MILLAAAQHRDPPVDEIALGGNEVFGHQLVAHLDSSGAARKPLAFLLASTQPN